MDNDGRKFKEQTGGKGRAREDKEALSPPWAKEREIERERERV
jgi:hypothetical protein